MRFNPFKFLEYHLYIFQLDEYEIMRYLRFIFKTRGLPPKNLRSKIRWTGKAKILEMISLILAILVIVIMIKNNHLTWINIWFSVLIILGCFYLHFIYLIVSAIILWPIETSFKKLIIYRASRLIKNYSKLKIIGVSGSYGKTLMKEMLAAVLMQKYNVVKTPENINTLLGISELINKKISPSTEIFIVEMGEYYPGDIRNICRLTPPSIGVITGINEAHLERMGSIETTIRTVFELATEVKSGGLLILNADDPRISENAERFSGKKSLLWYSSDVSSRHPFSVKNYKFHTDGSGISFDLYEKTSRVLQIKLPLLARYAVADVIASAQVARQMNLSWKDISIGISKVTPPPHRLQAIQNRSTGVLVIDDSYNGNPEGVTEAINVLSQFNDSRKIFITPGLVEMGQKMIEVHREIGEQLANVADLVILIQNSVTPFIAEGLISSGYPPDQIIRFDNALECHQGFAKYVQPKDVILFQNDWPDNYI